MKFKPLPKSRAKTAYGLLTEIRRIILAEPARYDQGLPLSTAFKGRFQGWIDKNRMPACGTVGCVAGWTVALKDPHAHGYVMDVAREILKLSHDQADLLFNSDAASGNPQSKDHTLRGALHIQQFQKQFAAQLKATRL